MPRCLSSNHSPRCAHKTIEESVNKNTQAAAGTKGFSLKPGAVTKYYLTAEYRSVYVRQLRDLIGQGRSKLSHPDLQGPEMKQMFSLSLTLWRITVSILCPLTRSIWLASSLAPWPHLMWPEMSWRRILTSLL